MEKSGSEPAGGEPVARAGAGRERRQAKVVSSRHLHRAQLKHFLLLDILPIVGTVVALALAFFVPITRFDIALFFAFWLVTGLGITVGFHRLASHGSFATSTPVVAGLLIAGAMAGRGAPLSWAAMHRRHHELADHDGDMHSPILHGANLIGRVRGFLHAQLTWMIKHDYPNVIHYVPDLLANPTIMRINKRYYVWVALGLALPALAGGLLTQSLMGAVTGLLWGGAVRLFVVAQSISLINSASHLIGSRPFRTRDDNSRNSMLLGLLAWGEGWHNNHHAFPYSAAFGLRWFQFDPGYLLIVTLEKARLVWDVKRPAARTVMTKRV